MKCNKTSQKAPTIQTTNTKKKKKKKKKNIKKNKPGICVYCQQPKVSLRRQRAARLAG
ncbi:hypothetical protein ACMBCN_01090 [Candidatus Liberibacter asiaticus]|nr:hypothetical protein [Candidatus Liberibacter asiaticus]